MAARSIIARLNDRWRVEDDGLQWILAVRRGRKDAAGTKWRGRRFHRCGTHLNHSIGELCGPVDPGTLLIIQALSEQYGQPRIRVVSDHEKTGDGLSGLIQAQGND